MQRYGIPSMITLMRSIIDEMDATYGERDRATVLARGMAMLAVHPTANDGRLSLITRKLIRDYNEFNARDRAIELNLRTNPWNAKTDNYV